MFALTCSLTAQQIENLLRIDSESVQLFDIRSNNSHAEIIEGSSFIDVSLLPSIFDKRRNETLYVLIDEDGEQAHQLVDLFKNNYPNVVYLEGGIQNWKNNNLPVKKVENHV